MSALGTGYTIIIDGKVEAGVGGTSASAPVFAGVVSLLNEVMMLMVVVCV